MSDKCAAGHGPDDFRGMLRVEMDARTLTFECPACQREVVVTRCHGEKRDGSQCGNAATQYGQGLLCYIHRRQDIDLPPGT